MDPSEVTPVEFHEGRWYKRDDLHRHPSGVNGGKWRQCQWLVARAADAGAVGIVTGASVLSPQLPMTAVAAELAGLPCVITVGGTTPLSAMRHPGVRLAVEHGARVHTAPVGYNPTLQAHVRTHLRPGWSILHYGVAPPADATTATVAAFHGLGAAQAAALPPGIEHLIVPFGSGNTAASVLLGLARHPTIRRVSLIGIGPNRERWLQARLRLLEAATGAPAWSAVGPRYQLDLFDLHAAGEVSYGRAVRYTSDGIVLHPTYEGKVADWLDRSGAVPGWTDRDGATCLWVVGGPLPERPPKPRTARRGSSFPERVAPAG